jgi:dTDP-4-amino-4,6-dideoxygalactose transaminase
MTDLDARPWVDFAAPDITEADIAAVVAVLRSGWLTTGPVVKDFEAALAAEVKARHVVTTSSCTTALECAVAALRLAPGSRVAVPSWTFVSSVTVLLRLGLVPVLIDSDPRTLNLSVRSLCVAADKGLSAVLPVHFGGTPVDRGVFAVARAGGLPVIEDCAHALGTTLPPDRGSVAACYSFYATKNLTTSEGGAVATDDDDVAEFCRSYRLHGLSRDAWRRYEPGGTPTYDVVTT